MQSLPTALNATLAAGAATWPLLAGLTLVLWSKARAAKPQPVPVRIRKS